MSIPSHPRIFARNIAEGYVAFNRASLKQFSPAELRIIYGHLEFVQREFRGMIVPQDDVRAVQRRNRILQRAAAVILLIRHHATRHRIPL